jgi:peptide/nickel transport system substrate-binding protein
MKDRPKFERLIFRVIADSSAQALALARGEIDMMVSMTMSQATQLAKSPDMQLHRKGGDGIGPLGWVAFNLARKPYDDVRVRQAVSYAIDRTFIVEQLHRGASRIATGPIAPGSPFYTDKVEPYALNLERSRQLLDAAGLKPDAQGVRFKATLDYLPGTPDNSQTVAEYLRPQLRRIGIDVTVRTSPDFPTWSQRVSNFDFDMTVDGAFDYGDPVIGVHRTYLSSNIRKGVIWSNTQSYSNPRVDALLAQATVERDPEKRKRPYAEFQRIVVDEVPVAFTHVWPQRFAARKGVVDIPPSIWWPITPYDTLRRQR